MTKIDLLNEVNDVLHTFAEYLSFSHKNNRLYLTYDQPGFQTKTKLVQVAKHSGALSINYGRLGMGGTTAFAVGQLARWIRGQTRVPISAWEYWTGSKIVLGGSNCDTVLSSIIASSYNDKEKTKCVLCGADRCGDWWCLDRVVGPCCTYGRCRYE